VKALANWQSTAAVLLFAVLSLLARAAPAAPVRIRFLDPTSRKPIRKMWVAVTQYKDKPPPGPIPAEYFLAFTSVKTDRNGEVEVQLHDPATTFISVHADLWYNPPLIGVDEVLNTGVVLEYSRKPPPKGCWIDKNGHCGMRSGSLLPNNGSQGSHVVAPESQPGLLVIVEKRISWWDRLRQELP
jgi:hypothetical protein